MATRLDQSEFIKTALRLPPELHEAVHASAEKSGRSYNAELVHLVERGLAAPDAYIQAPKLVRSVDAEGNYSEQGPRELFAELTQNLQRAFMIAGLFQEYADGIPSGADIDNPPDWVREAEERDAEDAIQQKGIYAPGADIAAAEARGSGLKVKDRLPFGAVPSPGRKPAPAPSAEPLFGAVPARKRKPKP